MAEPIPTLVCTCGHVMKAPGAKPGRVGKCTKCGALITVRLQATTDPDPPPRPAKTSAAVVEPDPWESTEPRRSTPALPSAGGYGVASEAITDAHRRRETESRQRAPIEARPIRPADLGPIKAPLKNERDLSQSLAYPLWSWSSIGLLAFVPVLLVFMTSPLEFLVSALLSDSPFVVPAYVSMIPVALFLLVIVGYVLIYLGNVLLASASGEVIPPRPPGIDDDIPRVLMRWGAAFVSGALIAGVPAYLYWLNCGDIDWIDRLAFVNLAVAGVAYTQMALVSALLHDDPLAANPVTVFKALIRLGTSYVGVCVLTVSLFALAGWELLMLAEVKNTIVHLMLAWLFWLTTLYLAMVVFRRLGLYCQRQQIIQSWFADRPRWGLKRSM